MVPPFAFRQRSVAMAIGVLVLLTGTLFSSCSRTILSLSNTTDTAEVFVQPAFGTDLRTRIAVLPFLAPNYGVEAGNVVTEAYYQELLRAGGFRQVTLVREIAPTLPHLPAWQMLKDYDLVLQGQILYLLSGTGNMPTQLQVEVRIVDVSRGTMAWYVKQKCVSQPGKDVDLVLKEVSGQPAQTYRDLAVVLARKFVQVITTPPEPPPGTQPNVPAGPKPPTGSNPY